MKTHRATTFLIASGIFCLLIIMPVIGYSADLTISDIFAANGNWTLNGSMTATSFSGDGSGLSNVTASGLSCTGCVSASQLNFTPGSVTSVGTGAGLTGGPITGSGSVSVDFAVTGIATKVARSDHSHDTIYQKKYGGVAVVAISGGDYTNPVDAMDNLSSWCGTPSETNPCLLKIMPGVYNIATWVQMEPYVDIEGSGENTTIVQGQPPENAIVGGANNAELRFLTLKITGGGSAIYNLNASPKLTNITAIASGSATGFTIFNSSHSSPVMTNVTAIASGGAENKTGIVNWDSSSPVMTNVTATASGGSYNCGISNASSSPVMTNVTATASGGTTSDGVRNDQGSSPIMTNVNASASGATFTQGITNLDSSPIMTNVTAIAKNGTNNRGMLNIASADSYNTVIIDRSTFEGSEYSVRNLISNGAGYTLIIGTTKFAGALPDTTEGIYSCVGAYFFDGALVSALGDNCQ